MCREYSSAIIQKNTDEIPQISFLEPLDAATAKTVTIPSSLDNININKNNLISEVNEINDNNNNSNNHEDGTDNDDGFEQSDKADRDGLEQQPRLTPKSLSLLTGRSSSPSAAPPALNVLQHLAGGDLNKFLSVSADLSQLTALLEQHKTLKEFLAQQQQQQQQHRLACPEHIDVSNLNDIDCKNCEFLNINNQMNSPLSSLKSPIKGGNFGQQQQTESNASSTSSKTSSPITSSVTPNSALHQQNLQQQSNLQTSPSFTIGACPDHINGRPIGVDCAR